LGILGDFLAEFSAVQIAVAVAATLGAAFIRGLTGFGFGILLVPILALALTPVEAVLAINIMAGLLAFTEIRMILREAERRSVLVIGALVVVGTAPGLMLLDATPQGLARLLIALIALEASSRRGRADSKDAISNDEALITLGPWKQVFAVLACAVPVLLGFAIPALHLTHLAVGVGDGLSWANLWSYALDSLWLGLAASFVCVIAALLLAFEQRRSASRATRFAIRIATLGYALPGALLAIGLLAPLGVVDQSLTRALRDTLGTDNGLLLAGSGAILIYALSVRFLTVAFNSVSGGLEKVPPSLDAAARSLGASPGEVMRRVHVPLLTPSLAAAGALVFIDTLRELPATLILRPFNLETLATRVYRLASDERLAEASTAALMILAAGLIPVLLLNRSTRRRTKSDS